MSLRNLDGSWQFRCAHPLRGSAPPDLSLDRWMPAKMPGTIHYQLERLGKIPDPYDARHELDVQWVDQQDWELRRTVAASLRDIRSQRQELVFDGLDTIAAIYLNGHRVGSSKNMFRRVVCDVRGVLARGENEVRIRLASPTAHAAREAKRGGQRPGKRTEFAWQTGERRVQHREWIRKVQCHFGWDWGLFLATSGVVLPARLECSDGPRMESIKTRQIHHAPRKAGEGPSSVDLEISVYLASPGKTRGTLRVECAGEVSQVRARLRPGETCVTVKMTVHHPELWWPAGEGKPHLYDLVSTWTDDQGSVERRTQRIGLRTIELITQNVAARSTGPAQSFFFRVNGRDIYAKGANWIPVDQFVDRATPSVYRHLLRSMVEANMNMVRVWGGGAYEQDVFYDGCDELGILVWQDFMMACALYPATKGFIAELVSEAKYQVRRLHDHPSIALWCGDNENAEAVWSWWKGQPDFKKTVAAYTKTLSALKKVCESEDATRRFWLSSPSNDELGPNPNDPTRGDIHYWKVWHGREPFANYLTVVPRFVSEFGFQSFPEARTLRAVVPSEQLNPSSRVMEHHQRSPDGNLLLTNTMAREMPIPHGFDSFCWVSQINQAMAIRTAVEHWRRLKPWCMGTLYWQLNDLWPVASWSSIDYHGRWKVLHHAAARFYAPLLVSLLGEDNSLHVWATSDIAKPLRLTGELDVLTWRGRRLTRVPLRVRLAAGASQKVTTIKLDRLLGDHAEPHEVCCFVRLSGDGYQAENYAPLVPWKWITLAKPTVQATVRSKAAGIELAVRTDVVTPFFHAELAGTESHFQGDWNVLRPGRTYVLPWMPHADRGCQVVTLSEAERRLHTLSLYDLYDHH